MANMEMNGVKGADSSSGVGVCTKSLINITGFDRLEGYWRAVFDTVSRLARPTG
jgi:hypothetical protein